MAFFHCFQEMDQLARAPAGDRRQFRRIGDAADQFQVVAPLGTVAQLAGRQHRARPQIRHFLREFHGIHARGRPAAIDEDLPLRRQLGVAIRIDGHHDGRAAEFPDRFGHERRLAKRRR